MEFQNHTEFAQYIQRLGGILWLVGGAVRDELRGDTPHDYDFMVTGISLDEMPFEKVVGHEFPVFLVNVGDHTCEVAMARKEKKSGRGHKGFKFFTDASVTIEDDLARRDLTINAMAKNVLTGEICDHFHGEDDLKNHLLRHTTHAFSEDPLRVFRVARFAAKFDFHVAEETLILMRSLVDELSTLPVERVWQELYTALQTPTPTPSRFFEVLRDVGALNVFFKEVSALDVPDKHDGTAFNHTMTVMNAGKSPRERFALLVHDFGKGVTPQEKHPSHYNHDVLGVPEVLSFCERLRVPNDFRDFGILCTRDHMKMKRAHEMRPGKFVRWVLGLGDQFRFVWHVSFIDSYYREGCHYYEESQRFLEVLDRALNAFSAEESITGNLLIEQGYTPGKHFGEVLFQKRVERFKQIESE